MLGLPKIWTIPAVHEWKRVRLAAKIAQLFQIPVEYQDERLTTVAAERMLIEQADVSRSKRKSDW